MAAGKAKAVLNRGPAGGARCQPGLREQSRQRDRAALAAYLGHGRRAARPQRVGSKIEETSAERAWSRRRRLAMASAQGATATSSSMMLRGSRRPACAARAFSASARTAGSTSHVSGRPGLGIEPAGCRAGLHVRGAACNNPRRLLEGVARPQHDAHRRTAGRRSAATAASRLS